MRRVSLCWSLFVCAMLCRGADANNNRFLPGDAFFPTELTAEKLAQLKSDPEHPPIFEYSSLGGYEGAFCGYAGYGRAKIPGVDKPFIDNLTRAYRWVRENCEAKELIEVEREGKITLRETNGVRVLFYPKDFEYPKFRLGLQYNENWVAEVMKFGHPPRSFRLCCLVDEADAVMESWRDATSVAALKAELPEVELKPVPETTEPATIRGPVKAFVMDSRPLAKYFNPPEDGDEDVSILVVDSSGIVEISYDDGELKRKKIEK